MGPTRLARAVAACGCALGLLASARTAGAQACCTATGSGELAVVGRCHWATAATQLSYQHALGSYRGDGRYQKLGARADDVVLTLGAGTRFLSRFWQVYGSLPLRLQYRRLAGLPPSTAFGPGDASLALRYLALEDPMDGHSALPFLDAFVGVKAPTGRAPEDGTDPSGADVTGDGSWQPFLGTKASKFVSTRNVAQLRATYARGLPRQVTADRRFSPGDEIALRAAWLFVYDLFWNTGVFVSWRMGFEAEENGRTIAGSATRQTRFGAHLTHVLDYPVWELTFAASTDAWWDGASANLPFVGPTLSLTLRHNVP